MSFTKKYLSYLSVINEKKYQSAFNGELEINWVNGKKVLDTANTNYSYGNLGKVLNFALQKTHANYNENTNILILGLGGGDIVKQLLNRTNFNGKITAVDIDPIMIEIAIKEFGIIPNANLDLICDDASLFVKYTKQKFDLIIVDLFYDTTIPNFVFSPTFIKDLNVICDTASKLIFNTFILDKSEDHRNRKFEDLLQQTFHVKSYKKLFGHNHLLIAENK